MKKIFELVFLAVPLLFSACELNREPESTITEDIFWKTENDLIQACNFFYNNSTSYAIALPGFAITEDNRSDDTFGTTTNSISDGSRIAPQTSGDWSNPYKVIRTANNILENASAMTIDPAVLCKYKAEAKFFRAWSYFSLVSKYGDVPLILKTLDIYDAELNMPRTAKETVIDTIYADLDYAAKYLNAADKVTSATYGRPTQSTALAFKSRVALYVGTHQKFHGYGQPAKHLQLAIDATEAVMNSKLHSLYTAKGANSYYSLFHYEGEGLANKENILVKIYGVDKANSIASHNNSRNMEQGYASPTRSLVESYLCIDGLPASKSPLANSELDANSMSTDIFENKDPRLNASIFKSGDANWLGAVGAVYKPTVNQIKTGFACKKYAEQQDWIDQVSYIDRILIRYAEVLLNYAEAKFELNNSITDEELDKSINLTRSRAGMPKLTNGFVTANVLDMREEIRRERRVELALEGFRYDDIIRWKIAEVVLPQTITGAKFFPSEYANVKNPKLTTEGYFLVHDAAVRFFDPNKDYLYPVPIHEITQTNGAITQNPNW